jgi:integrase
VKFLARADDKEEADGDTVMEYAQAVIALRELTDAPEPPPRAGLTVKQAMALYIERQRQAGSKSVDDLIYRVNAWINPTLGNKIVAELTPNRLRKWLEMVATMPALKRSKSGKPQQFRPEDKSEEGVRRRQSSANRILGMLKAGLNFAYDERLVSNNAAWGRRLKPYRGVDGVRLRFLSVAEAQRLINASAVEFRPLVEAALQTGCRYSELSQLEVEDFNPDAHTLHIRKSKTNKARHVKLTEEGAAFFRQHCAGRSGRMFVHDDGSPWKKSEQSRPMDAACTRAGIKRITIHGLRHTWASLCVKAGVPLIVVAKNLGHSDTRMVERHYGHLPDNFEHDAIRAGAPRFNMRDNKISVLR